MDPIDGLRQALAADPHNHSVRLLLAGMLRDQEKAELALEEYSVLLDAGALPDDTLVEVGHLALDHGWLDFGDALLQRARHQGVVEGVAQLSEAFDQARSRSGLRLIKTVQDDQDPDEDGVSIEAEATATFADVGGLGKLKKTLHRRIILPFQRPELLKRYGKKAGGGVLLYGPPGCGKTLLARATAGECGLPFFRVRIEDVLSPWVGRAEQNLHAFFDAARQRAPCVLFLDELDAVGFSRARMASNTGRPLVDQLLQELDAGDGQNEGVLILGATNAPWDLDDAVLRPGRFDRSIFVPPPDRKARREILKLHIEDRPVQGVDVKALSKRTERFSGADLEGLVERAFDLVLEEALETGTEPPGRMPHFEEALEDLRPSTGAWLERARNYVEFSNADERWEDVARYLKKSTGWSLFGRS